MSAFAPEDFGKRAEENDAKGYPYRRLEFGHAALGCMAVSVAALGLYYSGVISAQRELCVEIVM